MIYQWKLLIFLVKPTGLSAKITVLSANIANLSMETAS